MVNLIEAVIEGEDSGLSQALAKVSRTAEGAAESLEKVGDNLQSISASAEAAQSRVSEAGTEIGKLAGSSHLAEEAEEQLGDEMTGTAIRAETLNIVTENLSSSTLELAGTSRAAARGVDEMGDEAAEAGAQMGSAASFAELLSLQSSALSINVGAFTIALRNLTTQVPLLVTTLGNLSTAFLGLAGAVGAVGLGGFAVALGGALATAEQISGPLESSANTMKALLAIGQEFVRMLTQALQPLINMRGAAEAFKGLLEGIATTIAVFSEQIAESFSGGPLQEALSNVTSAWMANIQEIAHAVNELVRVIGVPVSEVLAEGIEALDEFIVFAANVTNDLMRMFGVAGQSVGQFVRELMRLGLSIASGIAPVLNSFFKVVSQVAKGLNSGTGQAIAMTVEVLVLVAAINRLSGILGSLIAPLAIISSGLQTVAASSSTLAGSFVAAAGTTLGAVTSMEKGFGSLVGQIQVMLPFVSEGENDLHNLADSINEVSEETSLLVYLIAQLSDNIEEATLDAALFEDQMDDTGDEALNFSAKLSLLKGKINGLTSGVDFGAFSRIGDAINDAANNTSFNRVLPGITVLISFVYQLIAALGSLMASGVISWVGDWAISMERSGGIAGRVGEAMLNLLGILKSQRGILSGLRGAWVALVGATNAASLSELLLATTSSLASAGLLTLTTVTSALISVITTLAKVVAILSGGLVVLIAIVGSVAAILMTLGSSGESAASIVRMLKSTIMDIVSTAMPLFIASGNAMINLFRGLMAVSSAVIGGLMDIGVALGLISQDASEGVSAMDVFAGIIQVLTPAVKAVGDAFISSFKVITKWVKIGLDFLKQFLTAIDFGAEIRELAKNITAIFRALMSGDIVGFFIELIEFIGDYMISVLTTAVKSLMFVFGQLFDFIGDAIVNAIAGNWNEHLAGTIDLGTFGQVQIPTIGGGGVTTPDIQDSRLTQDALVSGAGTAVNLGERAASTATGMGSNPDITYDEGNTINNFRQNISANPEDKAQISRIAKDAMEEANEMARRQQGSQ